MKLCTCLLSEGSLSHAISIQTPAARQTRGKTDRLQVIALNSCRLKILQQADEHGFTRRLCRGHRLEPCGHMHVQACSHSSAVLQQAGRTWAHGCPVHRSSVLAVQRVLYGQNLRHHARWVVWLVPHGRQDRSGSCWDLRGRRDLHTAALGRETVIDVRADQAAGRKSLEEGRGHTGPRGHPGEAKAVAAEKKSDGNGANGGAGLAAGAMLRCTIRTPNSIRSSLGHVICRRNSSRPLFAPDLVDMVV